jgi:protein-disulfide isomerase
VAQEVNVKPFYWGLGALAVVGGAWIWMSASRGNVAMYAEPVPASDTSGAAAFPGYAKGSDSARIEVHEYVDFTCPVCGRFAVLTFPDIEARLIQTGRIRWRFHDRPLGTSNPEHEFTYVASHAAACADEQGRFWEMEYQLFDNQSAWAWRPGRSPEGDFRNYARAIGLDLSRYDDCMKTGRYRARIQGEERAAEALGINSTPTFIIGTLRIPGALVYDEFKRVIDSVSARATAPR